MRKRSPAAQRENKPILLDIGAVWYHWCHVMDRESYESAETAGIINREFIETQEQKINELQQRPSRLESLMGTRTSTAHIDPEHHTANTGESQ